MVFVPEAVPQDKDKCDQLGAQVVDAMRYDIKFAGFDQAVDAVQNHFNTQIQNCLALVSVGSEKQLIDSSLYIKNNSNTGAELAFCGPTGCINKFNGIYPQGPISQTEFNALVQKYLSE